MRKKLESELTTINAERHRRTKALLHFRIHKFLTPEYSPFDKQGVIPDCLKHKRPTVRISKKTSHRRINHRVSFNSFEQSYIDTQHDYQQHSYYLDTLFYIYKFGKPSGSPFHDIPSLRAQMMQTQGTIVHPKAAYFINTKKKIQEFYKTSQQRGYTYPRPLKRPLNLEDMEKSLRPEKLVALPTHEDNSTINDRLDNTNSFQSRLTPTLRFWLSSFSPAFINSLLPLASLL